MKLVVKGILLVLFACAGYAQQAEFAEWMKYSNRSMAVLSKTDKQADAAVVNAAETLGAVYENMIGFWRQRDAADAVKLAMTGKNYSVMLASALNAGDTARAAEALKGVGGTCKPCHDAYRVRTADGKFRFK